MLFNSENVISDFFISLSLQKDVDFKLYVIENSETKDTLKKCKKLSEIHNLECELIFNDKNVGIAKGNNQGITLALKDKCSHILLANNDTEFPAGTLGSLLSSLSESYSAVTPKILFYQPENTIWYAGGHMKTWTMRTIHIGINEIDEGQYNKPFITDYSPTCFMLFNATVFNKIGSMDENYFVYYDDTDYIWRMNQAGLSILYESKAIIKHKVSSSTGGEFSPFTVYYTNRNRIYFIRKNFPIIKKHIVLSYVILITALKLVKTPKVSRNYIFKGIKDGLKMRLS